MDKSRQILVAGEVAGIDYMVRIGLAFCLQIVDPEFVNAVRHDNGLGRDCLPHLEKGGVFQQPLLQVGGDEDDLLGIFQHGAVYPPEVRQIAQEGVHVAVAHRHHIWDAVFAVQLPRHHAVAEKGSGMDAGNLFQIDCFLDFTYRFLDFMEEEDAMQPFQDVGEHESGIFSVKAVVFRRFLSKRHKYLLLHPLDIQFAIQVAVYFAVCEVVADL